MLNNHCFPQQKRELELNLFNQVRSDPQKLFRFRLACTSFVYLLYWVKKYMGMGATWVRISLYKRAYEVWLLLYLAEPATRLDYKKFWRTGNVVEKGLRIWQLSKSLIPAQRKRARSKLNRFFSSAKLLPQRMYYVRVATNNPIVFYRARRFLLDWFYSIQRSSSFLLRVYLSDHIKLVRSRVQRLSDVFADHIPIANHLDAEHVQKMQEQSPLDREYFNARRDVVWRPECWDIALEEPPENVLETVVQQIRAISSNMCIDDVHTTQLVQKNTARCVYENDVRASISKIPLSVHLHDFVHAERQEHEHKAYVPLDRDLKRRAVMAPEGYIHRLFSTFFDDHAFYRPHFDLQPHHVALRRMHNSFALLPKKWWPREPIADEVLPRGYHIYKAKCLRSAPPWGLVCQKSHAHEREIISNVCEPFRLQLRAVARSMRLVKRLSKEPSWNLWNQSKLATAVHDRVNALRVDPEHSMQCPCGAKKSSVVEMAKVDAAQFFKSASMERGCKRTHGLLVRVHKRTNCNAVAVFKGTKAKGALVRSTIRNTRKKHIILFDDIIRTLRFEKRNKYFLVGNLVVQRLRGWPMGAAVSEPGTMVDLGHDVYRLYKHKKLAAAVGWSHKDFSTAELIQGICHVDDCVLFSAVFCFCCLYHGLRRLWPKDVGVTLEEHGPRLKFLQAELISNAHEKNVEVRPYSPNNDFALGISIFPKFARLAHYIKDPGIHNDVQTCKLLRTFMWGRIITFDRLAEGNPERGQNAFIDLVAETLWLQWPYGFICSSLRSIPRRHRSRFMYVVRKFGKQLRLFCQQCIPADDISIESRRTMHAQMASIFSNLYDCIQHRWVWEQSPPLHPSPMRS